MNTPLSKPINIIAKVSDAAHYDILKENESYIARFSNPEEFVYGEDVEAPSDAVTSVITGAEIYLPLAGLINIEDEIARLEKEAEKLQTRSGSCREEIIEREICGESSCSGC